MTERAHLQTSFGCFRIEGGPLGIRRVFLTEERTDDYPRKPKYIQPALRQLEEYFRAERQTFDLKLDFGDATAFNRSVWEELLKVPYGQTTTYSAIAKRIGQASAVRAVGLANRNNPMAIIIPCHRCIAKNGDLQGYFYGLDMKQQLLELENPMSFARQGKLF